jgi:hypothetical protein
MSIEIDFLYWSECPSHSEAWDALQRLLAEIGVSATVNRRVIQTDEEAAQVCFIGSPTIRVSGHDVDPQTPIDAPARLTCRLYFREDGRPSAIPTETMLRNALELARKEHD